MQSIANERSNEGFIQPGHNSIVGIGSRRELGDAFGPRSRPSGRALLRVSSLRASIGYRMTRFPETRRAWKRLKAAIRDYVSLWHFDAGRTAEAAAFLGAIMLLSNGHFILGWLCMAAFIVIIGRPGR